MGSRTKRKYWNEPVPGVWERAYIFEIVRGVWITSSVFFANMWKWVTLRKGALTAYYPEELRADFSPNNRGRHVLTLRAGARDDGDVQCVACNLCATVCPAYCIEIIAKANPDDPARPKSPARFEIDYSRCIFCGFCVEACPEDAIRMAKEVPDLPAFDRDRMWWTIDLLKQWQPARDPRKTYAAESVAPAAQVPSAAPVAPVDAQAAPASATEPR